LQRYGQEYSVRFFWATLYIKCEMELSFLFYGIGRLTSSSYFS